MRNTFIVGVRGGVLEEHCFTFPLSGSLSVSVGPIKDAAKGHFLSLSLVVPSICRVETDTMEVDWVIN